MVATMLATPPTPTLRASMDRWAARVYRSLDVRLTFAEREHFVERAVAAAHRELVMAAAERAQAKAAEFDAGLAGL